jgi:hypothetical protein
VKSFRRRCLGWALPSLLLLAAPACQRPEDAPKPADLIPRDKMIGILADLHVLEARVENSRLMPDSARSLFLAQQKKLLGQRQVSDSSFQRSYRYYGIHGKDLNEIYQTVIDTLTKRAEKLEAAERRKATPPPTTTAPAAPK